jgi:hypothetical protein
MWVLAAPNPAIVAVYNTMYVESGLVTEKNFIINSELLQHECYQVYSLELNMRLCFTSCSLCTRSFNLLCISSCKILFGICDGQLTYQTEYFGLH